MKLTLRSHMNSCFLFPPTLSVSHGKHLDNISFGKWNPVVKIILKNFLYFILAYVINHILAFGDSMF